MITIQGIHADAIIYSNQLDPSAAKQIKELADTELADNIRIMPDYHAGAGCVIGTTMLVGSKVCPNLVGVDINCGITAVKLDEKITSKSDFAAFDDFLRTTIPTGFAVHKKTITDREETSHWEHEISKLSLPVDRSEQSRAVRALGTLGGGNHFIELGTDKANNQWLSVHSGSRGIGNKTAAWHQDLAISKNRGDVPKALSFLTGKDLDNYYKDLGIMTAYADRNRELMLITMIQGFFARKLGKVIVTDHNNITDGILHKGAVIATKGKTIMVPMNMADGILICKGLGNPDWNNCAPHGAGRLYSRSQARKILSMAEFDQKMKQVYSSSIKKSTLDESPMAYKPTDEISELIAPTAEIVDRIIPLYNFKDLGQLNPARRQRRA